MLPAAPWHGLCGALCCAAVRRDGGALSAAVPFTPAPGPVSPLTAVVSKVVDPGRPGAIDFGGASANDGMLILLCYTAAPPPPATLHLPFVAAAAADGGEARRPPSLVAASLLFMTC